MKVLSLFLFYFPVDNCFQSTGLALLAMCFNLMQEEVIHKMKNCGKRLGVIKDTEIEEEFDDEFDMP